MILPGIFNTKCWIKFKHRLHLMLVTYDSFGSVWLIFYGSLNLKYYDIVRWEGFGMHWPCNSLRMGIYYNLQMATPSHCLPFSSLMKVTRFSYLEISCHCFIFFNSAVVGTILGDWWSILIWVMKSETSLMVKILQIYIFKAHLILFPKAPV